MISFYKEKFLLFYGLIFLTFISIIISNNIPVTNSIFIFFSIISNVLFLSIFSKKTIIFEKLIIAYLWLGFWYKIAMNFLISVFEQRNLYDISLSGKFIPSINSFDEVFLISSVGLLGLLTAVVIRYCFFREIFSSFTISLSSIEDQYTKNKSIIVSLFLFILIAVCFFNSYFNFYQKGIIPRVDFFPPLSFFFKWFLLYGSLLITSVICYFEILTKKKIVLWPFLLVLFNLYLVNFSLISRSMPINTLIFFTTVYFFLKFHNLKLGKFNLFISIIIISSISFISVLHINFNRASAFNETSIIDINSTQQQVIIPEKPLTSSIIDISKPLLVDRWVGIETIMALQAHDNKGFDLYNNLLDEKVGQIGISFFDEHIIGKYEKSDFVKYNFNTSPGIIGFLFYSGNYLFLYCLMILVTLFGSFLSIAAYRLSGSNILFVSVIANVIAYRFISFGFAPFQSYYYFLSILLSILILPVLLFLLNFLKPNP